MSIAMSGTIVDSQGNPFCGAGGPATPDEVHKFQAKLNQTFGRAYKQDTYEDEESYNDMIVAKARMLKDLPFWGILALTVKLVECEEIPTLATDGRHVFYNAQFVQKLTRGELVFAMAHELYHCLYEHAGRNTRAEAYLGFDRNERDPKKLEEINQKLALWNYSADFIVNDGLVEAKVGEYIKTIQILHDQKYRGWSVEEVYDHLIQNPDEVPKGASTMDTHIEVEVVPDDEMDGEDAGKPQRESDGSLRVRIKQSDFDKMQKDWQDNMVSAASAQKEHEQRTQEAGCIPSGVQRLIDELTKPKLNWRQILRRYVMAVTHHRYSYNRPHKALFSQGWSLPGFRDRVHELDMVVMVDTSGSINQEQLTTFVSELQGIMNSWKRYKIKAWCFDGAVLEDSVTNLTKGSSDNGWNHVRKFIRKIGGGGGTDFEVNWNYMKENRIKPRIALMLTDGYPFGGWGDVSYCPTMYMVIGNPRAEGPKGAMTIHYEDA